ncbi:MAG: ATP-dependent DNA helicase [bacterium]|nr:ATP-dependent DNA helicase [bacterium]
MVKDKFEDSYAQLNPRQREAVDSIEGPVLVVAGPGTGKTQILTLRIANILAKTDAAPEQVLALTFTESGVASMRKRLSELIGSAAYAVNINTFHGWCNEVIKKYPEDFPRIIGAKNIHEVDQIEILEKLVEELPLKILKPFGDKFLYVKHLKRAVEELKREGLTPAEFKNILIKEQKNFSNLSDLYYEKGAHKGKMKGDYLKLARELEKNAELTQVYEQYEKKLEQERLYDFSDMIMEVLLALKNNPDLLQILQEEHQYLLVDEHQDTNNAQNKIIELLMSYHKNPNLFVVGDEKQAIYRFQGASLENFLYFKQAYPEAKLITLEDNYRSQQTILDSAHSLITNPSTELRARAKHTPGPIKIYAFDKNEEEIYWLANEIKEKIKAGEEPSEMAVLYRDNRDAFPLARMLEKLSIPFVIESDQDLLSQLDVRKLIIILAALAHFGEDPYLPAVLHLDLFKLEPLIVYALIRQAHEEKKHLWTLLKNDSDLSQVYDKLKEWHGWSKNDDLLTMFEKLVRSSGVLESILTSAEAEDRFEAVRRLYTEVTTLVESHPEATLADFFKYLETVKNHSLFIKRAKLGGRKGKVRLMTAHRSKGLEFDTVFMMGAYDGHWGGKRSRELLKLIPAVYSSSAEATEDADADERRLFYVALTRARQEVYISYAKLGENGKEQLASQFVTEIKDELKEEVNTSDWQEKYQKNKEIIFSSSPTLGVNSLQDREFTREIFLNQGLSVSALNNYLECPWRYFYRNLIRLPEAQNKTQLYGIAVHAALADAFRLIKDKDITKESLLASFEAHLTKLPLTQNDYGEVLAKGKKALAGWWEAYHEGWERNVLTEFKIKGILLTPEIKLTGVLDKLEFTGSGNEVRVVDYKTKQPMSRNAILGETKTDDDGNYFRQLVFYKLLLDKLARTDKSRGGYDMREGVIDFIEPGDNGKYKQESFEVTPENVAELEAVIKQAAAEILNLSFWPKRCADKDCEYCKLREVMK